MINHIINFWESSLNSAEKVVFDESFKTVKPQTLSGWFYHATNLTTIEGLEYLNTSEVTDMSDMFCNCYFLTAIDVSLFDTRNVAKMEYMFSNTSLREVDLRSFDVSKVISMSSMFQNCEQLSTIYCNDDWSNVESTSSMFENCQSLVGGNQTHYDPSHKNGSYARPDVEGIPGYFTVDDEKIYVIWCEDNSTLYFTYGNNRCIKNGIHAGHTVTKYWSDDFEGSLYEDNNPQSHPKWTIGDSGYYLQDRCQSVVIEPSFRSARPTSLRAWFYSFKLLTSIEGLDNLNTSEVTDMSQMFTYCSKLTSLDVNNFNTSMVTNIVSMFDHCSSLTTIYCNNDWSQGLIDETVRLFIDCTSLVGGNGKSYYEYDRNKDMLIYARPDSKEKPGYFTSVKYIRIGDVNGDGNITVTDVMLLVSHILGLEDENFIIGNADVNGDGNITVTDVMLLVSLILGTTASST